MAAEPRLTAPHEAPLHQLQNRLLNVSFQLEDLQKQVARISHALQASAGQVDVLTRHLTATQPMDEIHEQIATLNTHLATNQEQLEQISRHLDSVAGREQVERLLSLMPSRAELASLSAEIAQLAPREQLDQLLQTVANQIQVGQLDENFKRLSRTQFKANSLSESKEQQLQSALATLQELATRRAQIEETQAQRTAEQLESVRRAARGELAAELLPALDSLELALEHGATLLARQRTQQDAIGGQQQRYLADMQRFLAAQEQQIAQLTQTRQPAPPGMWRRLFGAAEEAPSAVAETPGRVLPPEPLAATTLQESSQATQSALQAWLQGIELVRQRFVALLATEEIQMIDALHRPFDPRLHVAVETAIRADVEPNRVVAVLRKGYRQRERILRYAEVVVAQRPVPAPSVGPDTISPTSTYEDVSGEREENGN